MYAMDPLAQSETPGRDAEQERDGKPENTQSAESLSPKAPAISSVPLDLNGNDKENARQPNKPVFAVSVASLNAADEVRFLHICVFVYQY